MVDYVALRATTKTLIDDAGRSVTINQLGNTPSVDDAMPWRTDERPVKAAVTGIGVFVADKVRGGVEWSMAKSTLDGMKTENSVLLFAAANDEGQLLENFHEVIDGSKTWRIVRVELLQPGTERLLYAIEVE